MAIKNNQILISCAVLFREHRGKKQYLLVKQANGKEWEIPKTTVRKGESSVRAVIRMIAESAGINAKVLEEAGRATGTAVVNGRTIPQKFYYYLMIQRSAGEVLGFEEIKWFEYKKALKELSLKRERDIFKSGKAVLEVWEKQKQKRS